MNDLIESSIIEVLMIEDSPSDVELTKLALEETKMYINLTVIMDGEETLAFLRQEGKYSKSPRPDLILLDLNLPKKDGREILAEIKKDDDLKVIPVIILTTSEADEDILKAYNLHANAYISKPVDLNQFIDVIKGIENFWLAIVKLPSIS